jgi:hypothetical protein
MPALASGALEQQVRINDRASAFFDDSTVTEIQIYCEEADWYNTQVRGHQSAVDRCFSRRFKSGDLELAQIGCRVKGNSSLQRNGSLSMSIRRTTRLLD